VQYEFFLCFQYVAYVDAYSRKCMEFGIFDCNSNYLKRKKNVFFVPI
jgi:hypothetical protein